MQLKLIVCIGGFMNGITVHEKEYEYWPVSKTDHRNFYGDLTAHEKAVESMPECKYELRVLPNGQRYYVLEGDPFLQNEYLNQIQRSEKF